MSFKLTPKQQIALIGVILAAILLLFIGFFVVPQILRLGTLGVEEQSAMTELNSSKATYSQLEELKKASRKTDNELLRLDKKAPESGAELPALLVQIEDVSVKSGIALLSIKPSNPVQKTDFKEVTMEMQIDGYFFSLLDFIYRLEKLQRIINVTGIDVKEGKAKLPNIEVTVKANAYIISPGVTGAKTAAPSGTTGETGSAQGAATSAGGSSTGAAQ
ncbi:MAG: type 4a pilus biogenesis protein PilO [Actinomycetota bacterium]